MRSAIVLFTLIAACGGRAEMQETQSTGVRAEDPCGPLERQAAAVWCDRDHPLAFYCEISPSPDRCTAVKQADDGTADALYCCAP